MGAGSSKDVNGSQSIAYQRDFLGSTWNSGEDFFLYTDNNNSKNENNNEKSDSDRDFSSLEATLREGEEKIHNNNRNNHKNEDETYKLCYYYPSRWLGISRRTMENNTGTSCFALFSSANAKTRKKSEDQNNNTNVTTPTGTSLKREKSAENLSVHNNNNNNNNNNLFLNQRSNQSLGSGGSTNGSFDNNNKNNALKNASFATMTSFNFNSANNTSDLQQRKNKKKQKQQKKAQEKEKKKTTVTSLAPKLNKASKLKEVVEDTKKEDKLLFLHNKHKYLIYHNLCIQYGLLFSQADPLLYNYRQISLVPPVRALISDYYTYNAMMQENLEKENENKRNENQNYYLNKKRQSNTWSGIYNNENNNNNNSSNNNSDSNNNSNSLEKEASGILSYDFSFTPEKKTSHPLLEEENNNDDENNNNEEDDNNTSSEKSDAELNETEKYQKLFKKFMEDKNYNFNHRHKNNVSAMLEKEVSLPTTAPVIIGSISAEELLFLPSNNFSSEENNNKNENENNIDNAEICFGGWLYISMDDEQKRLIKCLEGVKEKMEHKKVEVENEKRKRRQQNQKRRKKSRTPERKSIFKMNNNKNDEKKDNPLEILDEEYLKNKNHDNSSSDGNITTTTTTTTMTHLPDTSATAAPTEDENNENENKDEDNNPLPKRTPSKNKNNKNNDEEFRTAEEDDDEKQNNDEASALYFPTTYIIVAVPLYELDLHPTTFLSLHYKARPVSLNYKNEKSKTLFGDGVITKVRYGGIMIIEIREKLYFRDASLLSRLFLILHGRRFVFSKNNNNENENKNYNHNKLYRVQQTDLRSLLGGVCPKLFKLKRQEHIIIIKHKIYTKLVRDGIYVVLASTKADLVRRQARIQRLQNKNNNNKEELDAEEEVLLPEDLMSSEDEEEEKFLSKLGYHTTAAHNNNNNGLPRSKSATFSPNRRYRSKSYDEFLLKKENAAKNNNNNKNKKKKLKFSPSRFFMRHPNSSHNLKNNNNNNNNNVAVNHNNNKTNFYIRGTYRQIGGVKYLDVYSLLEGNLLLSELTSSILLFTKNLLLMPVKARPLCIFFHKYEGLSNLLKLASFQGSTTTAMKNILSEASTGRAAISAIMMNNISFASPTTNNNNASFSNLNGSKEDITGGSFFAGNGSVGSSPTNNPNNNNNNNNAVIQTSTMRALRSVSLPFQTYYNGALDPLIKVVLPKELNDMIKNIIANYGENSNNNKKKKEEKKSTAIVPIKTGVEHNNNHRHNNNNEENNSSLDSIPFPDEPLRTPPPSSLPHHKQEKEKEEEKIKIPSPESNSIEAILLSKNTSFGKNALEVLNAKQTEKQNEKHIDVNSVGSFSNASLSPGSDEHNMNNNNNGNTFTVTHVDDITKRDTVSFNELDNTSFFASANNNNNNNNGVVNESQIELELLKQSYAKKNGNDDEKQKQDALLYESSEWKDADKEVRQLKAELEELKFLHENAKSALYNKVEEFLSVSSLFLPHTRFDQLSLQTLFLKSLRQIPQEVFIKELQSDWISLLFVLLNSNHEELFCTPSYFLKKEAARERYLEGMKEMHPTILSPNTNNPNSNNNYYYNDRNDNFANVDYCRYKMLCFPVLKTPSVLKEIIISPSILQNLILSSSQIMQALQASAAHNGPDNNIESFRIFSETLKKIISEHELKANRNKKKKKHDSDEEEEEEDANDEEYRKLFESNSVLSLCFTGGSLGILAGLLLLYTAKLQRIFRNAFQEYKNSFKNTDDIRTIKRKTVLQLLQSTNYNVFLERIWFWGVSQGKDEKQKKKRGKKGKMSMSLFSDVTHHHSHHSHHHSDDDDDEEEGEGIDKKVERRNKALATGTATSMDVLLKKEEELRSRLLNHFGRPFTRREMFSFFDAVMSYLSIYMQFEKELFKFHKTMDEKEERQKQREQNNNHNNSNNNNNEDDDGKRKNSNVQYNSGDNSRQQSVRKRSLILPLLRRRNLNNNNNNNNNDAAADEREMAIEKEMQEKGIVPLVQTFEINIATDYYFKGQVDYNHRRENTDPKSGEHEEEERRKRELLSLPILAQNKLPDETNNNKNEKNQNNNNKNATVAFAKASGNHFNEDDKRKKKEVDKLQKILHANNTNTNFYCGGEEHLSESSMAQNRNFYSTLVEHYAWWKEMRVTQNQHGHDPVLGKINIRLI